jgi:hypothetical protein
MERSDIRVLPSKCEATGLYVQARAGRDCPTYANNHRIPDFATLNPGYSLILFMGFITFLAGAFGAFDAAVRRGGQNGACPVQITTR